jgi:hypothetical protein
METTLSYKMDTVVCQKSPDGTITIKPRTIRNLLLPGLLGLLLLIVLLFAIPNIISGKADLVMMVLIVGALVIGMILAFRNTRQPTIHICPMSRTIEMGSGPNVRQIPFSSISHIAYHSYETTIASESGSADIPVVEVLVELNDPDRAAADARAQEDQARAFQDYSNLSGLRQLMALRSLGRKSQQRIAGQKKAMIRLGRVSGKTARTRGDAVAQLLEQTIGVTRHDL